MKRALALGVLLSAGCPNTGDEATVRVAADRTLAELGLVEYVLAAFEEATKTRTRLVYDDTDQLKGRAASGQVDYVFMVSEASLESLEKEGVAIRAETYAHEEFVVIGPFEDMLGQYNRGDAVELIQSIARSSYRFLKGKPGSVEHARFEELFERSGDRAQVGSIFPTQLEGVPLVKQAIELRTFALVKRSSVLQAAMQGHLPHRLYREGEPLFVLRMVLIEVHPAKTRMERKPELFDWILGEKGRSLVESFGERQFGYPVFGVGQPPEGQGARVPKLKEKEGLERATEEKAE